MPLLTTIPTKIKNPISVLALGNELPVKMIAQSDPIAARGMVNIIMSGFSNDSNVIKPVLLHIYHHWGDGEWQVWNDVKKLVF